MECDAASRVLSVWDMHTPLLLHLPYPNRAVRSKSIAQTQVNCSSFPLRFQEFQIDS
jgi:hypothetical protein